MTRADELAVLERHPTPWALREEGRIRDRNGEFVCVGYGAAALIVERINGHQKLVDHVVFLREQMAKEMWEKAGL